MQPIAEWLNALGLGQYAERFADNDIDANILRDLTDADLEKIGVSLGHRLSHVPLSGEAVSHSFREIRSGQFRNANAAGVASSAPLRLSSQPTRSRTSIPNVRTRQR
jgi:hypothetical protein